MSTGKRIKDLREKMDLTQKELADKIKMNDSVLSRIESGERPIRDDELNNIADILGVSTDFLLGRTKIKNSADNITSAIEDDKELLDFWNTLKDREDLQLLFKQTKDLGSKDIQQIIRIIKAIEDEEDRTE